MRFRLYPTCEQEGHLLEQCAQARFVWNLALEQHAFYERRLASRVRRPSFVSQSRELTLARRDSEWLRLGSQCVQQQALRDLEQAWKNFFGNPAHFGRPSWRRKGRHEGFRIVGKEVGYKRISRRGCMVWIPKIGWVEYRWTRDHANAKSYRVRRDAAGRWWISFALKPAEIRGPGSGEILGIDRGIANSFSFSNGEHHQTPNLKPREQSRALRLKRKLARQAKGSKRRDTTKRDPARLDHRGINRKKDFIEKLSTRLAREYDTIRIEDLQIRNMTRSARGSLTQPGVRVSQKRGLNRSIQRQGWGLFAQRLKDKTGTRLERVPAQHTSTTCSACGHNDLKSRESQALFTCTNCNTMLHADTNAAKNIAAGQVVRGRGATQKTKPTRVRQQAMKRQPTRKALAA